MQNNISCLIFDFDGVIANTDLGRLILLKDILKNYNSKLLKSFSKKDLIGLSTKGFLKKFTVLNENEINHIVNKRHDLFFANLKKYCVPYKGMADSIKYFSSMFDLAIATTNDLDNVKIQLEYLEVLQYFKWIFGRETTENKRFEKTYHLVAKIIGKKNSECIVIEDSDYGVNAAIKEGFYCIRFDSESIFTSGIENIKVTDYNELKNIIDKTRHANNV